MDTRKLVDPALLPVLDAFPTVALSDDLLGPMRDAERLAQSPVSKNAAANGAIEQTLRTVPGPAGAPDMGGSPGSSPTPLRLASIATA